MATELRTRLTQMRPGDHLCLLYESHAERVRVSSDFLAEGLAAGQRCVLISGGALADGVRAALVERGVEVADAVEGGGLVFVSPDGTYLQDDRFDGARARGRLAALERESRALGYAAVRIAADTDWSHGRTADQALLAEYEGSLCDLFDQSSIMALCMYDRHRTPPETSRRLLEVHPLVVTGAELCPNPFYEPPAVRRSEPDSGTRLEWRLAQLRELRDSHAATAEREETFRALLEHAPDIIARLDCDLRYLYINENIREVTGLSPTDFEGRTNRELGMSDALVRTWNEAGERVLATAAPTTMEFEYAGPVREYWFQTRMAPEFGPDGRVTSLLAITRDITRHKQAQRARERVERRYTRLFETMPQGVVYHGPDGRIIDANPAAESMLGVPLDSMQGATATDPRWGVVDEEGRPLPPERLPAEIALQSGQDVDDVLLGIATPDGERRWLLVNARPERDREGGVVAVFTSFTDITAQREAELALLDANTAIADRETHLRAVLDSLDSYVGVLDPDGVVLEANRASLEGIGAALEDVQGLPFRDTPWWHAGQDEVIRDAVERARSGKATSFDITVPHVSGGQRRMQFNIRPMTGPDGTVTHLIPSAIDVTERSAAEQRLRENEARFRLMVEGSEAVFFYVHDLEGRFEYVSPSVEQVLGYPPEQVLGRSYEEIVVAADLDLVVNETSAATADGVARPSYRARVRCMDGRIATLELTETPVRFDGETETIQGFARDITELTTASDALASSERRLRAIVETMNEALLIVREDGSVAFSNPAARDILGTDRVDVYGAADDAPWQLADLDGRPLEPHATPVARVLSSGEVVQEFEHRVITADGTARIVSANAAPLDWNGRIHSVLLTLRDVTESRQVQADLRAVHGQLLAVLKTTPVAIVMVDPERRVRLWNRAAEELFGWSADEVLGRPYPVRAPEGDEVVDTSFSECIEGILHSGVDVERIARGGETLELNMWDAPLHDDRGELIGLVAIFVDVSEQNRLEGELRQAQKMDAIGRLAGGVAHDFNNMLTSVIGHAELVLDALGPGEQTRADVEEVRRSAERAQSLTRQLLAFSRKQVLTPQTLDLRDVLEELQQMLGRLIGEDVELVSAAPGDLWPVRADPNQMGQVLLNLAVNARDAMPDGGVLRISAANAPADTLEEGLPEGDYVLLRVSDTGVGIEPEALDQIFEPFFTTKAPGQGTGLGLSTVYGIVAQSGGHVRVTSEKGSGTTFRIYLPRSTSPVRRTRPAQPGPSTAAPETGTVLLVEDEEAVRKLAVRVLARAGHEVIAASNGEEALERVADADGAIDVVVSDLVMPRMSGRELVKRLAADDPDLAIVLMSGYSEELLSQQGGLEEGESFLEKPFTPRALVDAVHVALKSRAAGPTRRVAAG